MNNNFINLKIWHVRESNIALISIRDANEKVNTWRRVNETPIVIHSKMLRHLSIFTMGVFVISE
jgi:hypothetical protein